jgi:phage tail-like protein
MIRGRERLTATVSGRADVVSYDGFQFVLEMDGRAVAGFSEASGLTADASFQDFQPEAGVVGTIRKLVGSKKYPHITLERGMTGSSDLWEWWRESRRCLGGGTRDVVIVARDERRDRLRAWCVESARCRALSGPALSAKDVSTSIERLEIGYRRVKPA